ncbi:MgtC/SapB family protein [Natronospora cellulosivora (SeqCode)]
MLDILINICLISLLAGVIGWDREKHGRPAGFRTHILVGIGSTILMMVSYSLHEIYPDADPARIAAQVVSGIGFLGAGTILIQGSIVKGLTTAASLWTTAAIGLAVGASFYFLSIVATIIVFISLFFLSNIEYGNTKIRKQKFKCTFKRNKGLYNEIHRKFQEKKCEIKFIETNKSNEEEINLKCIVEINNDDIVEMNSWLLDLEEIKELTWEDCS